jgi:hypothetical protein
MRDNQLDTLLAAISSEFDLPPDMTVTAWCEQHLELTALQADQTGPYSTSLTPYVREVLECVRDPEVEEVVLCWGAQTAKTMTLMSIICWLLVNLPRPVLWVMPNKDLAQSFSENRLRPLIGSCAPLISTKTRDRHRWKKTEMAFDRAVLNLVGSNSPANLASRPAGCLVMDETDKFAEANDREANALELAELRTRTFASPKLFKTSTPSTAEGPIWQAFLRGDQRRFAMPCPNCAGLVIPVMDPAKSALKRTGMEAPLKWDKDAKGPDGWDFAQVAQSAHLECPHCKGQIWDRSKTAMLRAGKWVVTNPIAPAGVRSYHLPSFTAPWVKTQWGRLAVEFLKATVSLEGLKGFITGTLAEPDLLQWEGGGAQRTERIIANGQAEPLTSTALILTADKQLDHLWWLIREWAPGGNSRLVAWGRCGTEDDLEVIRGKYGVAADLTGIDSGHESSTVLRECLRFGWFALRGEDRKSWPEHHPDGRMIERPYRIRLADPLIGLDGQGTRTVTELRFAGPTLKDILARLRRPDRSPVRWEVPEELATDEYWRHLDGEYKARKFNARTGRVYYEWTLRSRHWPNHLLDCEVEQIAVALKVGILAFSPNSTADDTDT